MLALPRLGRLNIVPRWGLLSALFVVGLAEPARADERVEHAVDELRNNEDFRVRTQAALALGASKDKRAVRPLCEGLEDSNATVRASAAAALGRLALGGADCLKARLEEETNASVKSVLTKSLEKVNAALVPSVTAATKYYIAIGPTTDKTGRSGASSGSSSAAGTGGGGVDDMVHQAMSEAAGAEDGWIVAPVGEKAEAAGKLFTKFKQLRGFFLWPKVQSPEYTNGKLTIRFELSVFTYPGKALKGTIPFRLTMPDVTSKDRSAEDELIKQAAASAIEKFSANAERFQ